MLAFTHQIYPNLPSATKLVQQVIIKLEVKPSISPSAIRHSYLSLSRLKISIPVIALNTDTDIPPIISDTGFNSTYHEKNTYTTSHNHEINRDETSDISPYRSRSVLYVEPKKVNLNEFKDA